MACGIPLISAPWIDSEHLFTPGEDFVVAENKEQMKSYLRRLLSDPELSNRLHHHGLKTIRSRHTCAHRVDELFSFLAAVQPVYVSEGKA